MNIRKTKFYDTWKHMRQRCLNKNASHYEYYGGRGISICESWSQFENFYNDMFASYKEGLWLDRINVNENYSKKNCKWSTPSEQARNKTNTFLAKGKTFAEWSEILGIKRSTLAQRYYVYKWPIDKVLTI